MEKQEPRSIATEAIQTVIDTCLSSEQRGYISDGYHTFDELYEHRHLLFARLAEWKSKKHSNGSEWFGWFIAGIGKEPRKQITYHIPVRLWDFYKCEESDKAPEFDGHNSDDVLERLAINK